MNDDESCFSFFGAALALFGGQSGRCTWFQSRHASADTVYVPRHIKGVWDWFWGNILDADGIYRFAIVAEEEGFQVNGTTASWPLKSIAWAYQRTQGGFGLHMSANRLIRRTRLLPIKSGLLYCLSWVTVVCGKTHSVLRTKTDHESMVMVGANGQTSEYVQKQMVHRKS